MSDRIGGRRSVSRRRVLQGIGGGLSAGALANPVAAMGSDDSSQTPHRVLDQHNVGIRPGHESAGIPAARQAAGTVRKTIDLREFGTIVNGVFSRVARDALRNNPHVEYVEPDFVYSTAAETLPWGIDRIDAENLYRWDTIGTAADATVAVLDTGIDDDHPDLQSSDITGRAFGTQCGGTANTDCCPNQQQTCPGSNGNSCTFTWSDDNDHGTHVAGTIAADDDDDDVVGISPGIDLLIGKVLNGCGRGGASDIADGIRWATDEGADVINMSLSGAGGRSMQKACQYAWIRNVVVVAAAGNAGPCDDCVGWPARYSTVIGVSNITETERLRRDSQNGPEIELGAPGNRILSTVPPESTSSGIARKGGTSMASPHVAGTAALVKDLTTLSHNHDIRARLRSSAENLSSAPEHQGYGMVDALETTNSVLRSSSPDVPQFTPYHETFEVDHDWTTVVIPGNHDFSDPVVVAGPATHNGWHPTTVRVKDVGFDPLFGTYTADLRLQEWEYLDGWHTTEEVTLAVFESGSFAELDGAQAETGHLTGVDHTWQSVTFKEFFDSGTTPIVIPQCVTENGSDPVTVRLRNVDNLGFDVRLQEEEARGRHIDEQVDYLAIEPTGTDPQTNTLDVEAGHTGNVVDDSEHGESLDAFDNRPGLLGQIQTFDGPNTCNLRVNEVDASGFHVTVDEETSADSETTHTTENVGYVALEQFENEPLPYDTGTGTTDQPDRETWHRVTASREFDDPVVVMGPPTHDGGQPVKPRVRNIGTKPSGLKSFDFQLEEWAYLDGAHISERVSYGIFEAGAGTIDGARVEAGYQSDVESNWEQVLFTQTFSEPPVVLPQCTSQTGDDPVTVRIRNVATYGFEVRLQEEEGADREHTTERVDYLAIEPADTTDLEVATTGDVVTDSVTNVALDGFHAPPDLLAAMQTTDGANPAAARLTKWEHDGFGVFLEEEQSSDGETAHTTENVGYAAFAHTGPIFPISRTVDTVTTDQPDENTWHAVETMADFRHPVVVMGPPTHNGSNPMTVRVRNVNEHSADPFEFQYDEWEYLDGRHIPESVSYGVFEAGVGRIESGYPSTAEAGTVGGVDENWTTVSFDLTAGFDFTPVVVAQCTSTKGTEAVTTRIRNVTTDGFEVRLQEQEANGKHTWERVDYVAAEPLHGIDITVDTTGTTVDHTGKTVDLSGFDSTPHVLAQIQTYNGPNTCNLRIEDVSASGFHVFVDEEQSADTETRHIDENVGYIAIDGS